MLGSSSVEKPPSISLAKKRLCATIGKEIVSIMFSFFCPSYIQKKRRKVRRSKYSCASVAEVHERMARHCWLLLISLRRGCCTFGIYCLNQPVGLVKWWVFVAFATIGSDRFANFSYFRRSYSLLNTKRVRLLLIVRRTNVIWIAARV